MRQNQMFLKTRLVSGEIFVFKFWIQRLLYSKMLCPSTNKNIMQSRCFSNLKPAVKYNLTHTIYWCSLAIVRGLDNHCLDSQFTQMLNQEEWVAVPKYDCCSKMIHLTIFHICVSKNGSLESRQFQSISAKFSDWVSLRLPLELRQRIIGGTYYTRFRVSTLRLMSYQNNQQREYMAALVIWHNYHSWYTYPQDLVLHTLS